MSQPLVTITIPTLNSARSLHFCLDALKNQTYKNIEINIVDGFSDDDSINIARKYHIKKIKKTRGSLLQARHEGVKMANGVYVLILDSDQILSQDAIGRAVNTMKKKRLDMLALEESVYQSKTIVEKLFDMDRKLINKLNNLNPFTGVIMPRFFRKELLTKAYANISQEIFRNTGGPDHAIVYYEAWLMSKKVGILKDSVKHVEPYSLQFMMRKMYRWGYTSVAAHYGPYHSLMKQKERFRTGLFSHGLYYESLASIVLLLFKGIAFKTGYYVGVVDRYRHVESRLP